LVVLFERYTSTEIVIGSKFDLIITQSNEGKSFYRDCVVYGIHISDEACTWDIEMTYRVGNKTLHTTIRYDEIIDLD